MHHRPIATTLKLLKCGHGDRQTHRHTHKVTDAIDQPSHCSITSTSCRLVARSLYTSRMTSTSQFAHATPHGIFLAEFSCRCAEACNKVKLRLSVVKKFILFYYTCAIARMADSRGGKTAAGSPAPVNWQLTYYLRASAVVDRTCDALRRGHLVDRR